MLKKILILLQNNIIFCDGVDINIKGVWYGLHYYWQRIPLFDIIYRHRKLNSIHEYGITVFGLSLYIKIDV